MVIQKQVRVTPDIAFVESNLKTYIAKELHIDNSKITDLRILKRNIDARQRIIFVNITLDVFIDQAASDTYFTPKTYPDVSAAPQVVVVGEGPSGLFAALKLIENGIKPIVIERGKDVKRRQKDLAKIPQTQQIDPQSNYSFGEGGAGAFSDGKLYTRSKKRGDVDGILQILCQHGASDNILYEAHPHIGTDKLPKVIANIRETILRSGGEVHHETLMTALNITNDCIDGCVVRDLKTGVEHSISGPVILATGHSARDVYEYLYEAGIEIEPKGLAIGVRIEHSSALIDRIQYHNKNGRGRFLPAAEYRYVTQIDGRGVYSFCMCPGGFIIPAATADRQVVVNGMSPNNRGGKWSNSGMVVEIRTEDVAGQDPLKMMRYQEEIEYQTWLQSNRTQKAPAQRMLDFVQGKLNSNLPKSSYTPGLIASPIHFWMPEHISSRLRKAFVEFGKKSKGFLTNEALIIASETRTSAPIKITRDLQSNMHIRVKGLFPCGEGAGYAGGIVSAAIDGEKCAEQCALYLKQSTCLG